MDTPDPTRLLFYCTFVGINTASKGLVCLAMVLVLVWFWGMKAPCAEGSCLFWIFNLCTPFLTIAICFAAFIASGVIGLAEGSTDSLSFVRMIGPICCVMGRGEMRFAGIERLIRALVAILPAWSWSLIWASCVTLYGPLGVDKRGGKGRGLAVVLGWTTCDGFDVESRRYVP